MTGTERALQILQSARVWSSSPYDAESLQTLHLIAGLAPIRTFYPSRLKVMQQIQWPSELSPVAAQESFLFIAQKLISDSQRLSGLHFQDERTEIKTKTFLPLHERAHARHSPYIPNCNILESFIRPRNTLARSVATETDINVSAVRRLAALYDGNEFVIPGNVNIIFDLLIPKSTLEGVSRRTVTNIVDFCSVNDLANMWIRLYDFAHSPK